MFRGWCRDPDGGGGNVVIRPNDAPSSATGVYIATEPWVTGLGDVDFPCQGSIQFEIPGQGLTNVFHFNLHSEGCTTAHAESSSQPGRPPSVGSFAGTWEGEDAGDGSIVTLNITQWDSRLEVELSDSYSSASDGRRIAGHSGSGTGRVVGSAAEVTFRLVGPDGDSVEVVAELTLSGEALSLTVSRWGQTVISPPGPWADLRMESSLGAGALGDVEGSSPGGWEPETAPIIRPEDLLGAWSSEAADYRFELQQGELVLVNLTEGETYGCTISGNQLIARWGNAVGEADLITDVVGTVVEIVFNDDVILVAGPREPAASRTSLASEVVSMASDYSGYDYDGDGEPEIRSVQWLELGEVRSGSRDRGLVLVLVEKRLLAELGGNAPSIGDLRESLERFQEDLEADGYHACMLTVELYNGSGHQDGLTLLALREMLRQAHTDWSLRGVILVGGFPEAMLVRTWQWQRTVEEHPVKIADTEYGPQTRYFTSAAEVIASRADIVLADLDGHWEDLYHKTPTAVTGFKAVADVILSGQWKQDMQISFLTSVYEEENHSWEDFFLIDDLDCSIVPMGTVGSGAVPSPGQWKVTAGPPKHAELTETDKGAVNPLAKPEILVSRINARNVAVSPDSDFLSGGRPRFVAFPGGTTLDVKPEDFWYQDAALERSLLIYYLELNHKYRMGVYSTPPYGSHPCRVSAISSEDFPITGTVKGIASGIGWLEMGNVVDGKKEGDVSVLDYAEWWLHPAALRWISAHSSPQFTNFSNAYDVEALESLVSTDTGGIWRWIEDRVTEPDGTVTVSFQPSFEDQNDHADLHLHRSLWESGLMVDSSPCLLVHTGCDINSPQSRHGPNVQHGKGYTWRGYTDPDYAVFQNIECLEFYMGCLAIIARAKGFWDEPLGVANALGSYDACFGEVWVHNFDEVANLSDLTAPSSAGSKKAYWWSLMGDWSLELRDWHREW